MSRRSEGKAAKAHVNGEADGVGGGVIDTGCCFQETAHKGIRTRCAAAFEIKLLVPIIGTACFALWN